MEKTKNILHLMGMESTKYGGIERFNVELSRQLAGKGYHSVFVYEDYPEVQAFVDDLIATGAKIVVINSRKHKIAFCKQFWRLLKQYDFQMMHAHFTKARFYAVPLALMRGIKNIVYTFHSTIEPLNEIKMHTRAWYALFNRYCRIVAVSQDIANVSKKNWPKALIENIYLGIRPVIGNRENARKELGLNDNTLMVMCTANFNHVKGLDILVEAIARLKHMNALEHVMFYVVGQPDKDRVEMQKQIEELGISEYIQLEGISNQIPKYLTAADIYVQPSRNEGLPLALMEACSAGLPIVASRIGGIPEVAIEGENAILFKSENVDECAEALVKMLASMELREKCGERSFEIYQDKFKISNNVAKLIEYYE